LDDLKTTTIVVYTNVDPNSIFCSRDQPSPAVVSTADKSAGL
jgi:hypothetical protein